MSTLTDWFPSTTKPVHISVYETDLGHAMERFGYSYWNGKLWSNQYPKPSEAKKHKDWMGVQDKRWRGRREK